MRNLIDKKVILRLFPFSLRSFSSSDLAPPPSRFFVLILKITNSTGGNLNRSIVRFFLDGLEKRPKGPMPGSAIECGPISTPEVTTKCHFKSFLPNSSKWLDLWRVTRPLKLLGNQGHAQSCFVSQSGRCEASSTKLRSANFSFAKLSLSYLGARMGGSGNCRRG